MAKSTIAFAERKTRAPWHVAFSGGADSVATLLLVWAHWPAQRARVTALHFNHRLRGAAADADELFCREVCRGLGVSLKCGAWRNVPKNPSESAARTARHDFFGRHSRVLWLGHHQDDVAETMLMRLARGSGAGGLSAPRPVHTLPGRRVHLRPLLTLRKKEIHAALREAKIPWREDATNSEGRYFRNRVRNSVIAGWEKSSQRDAVAGAALARELLEEDDDALNQLAHAPLFYHGKKLDVGQLRGQPRAIVRRSLHRWLAKQTPPLTLSRQAFETLLAAVLAGQPSRQSMDATRFAVIQGDVLFVTTKGRKVF